MTPSEIAVVLNTPLWGTDDSDYRVLANAMVTARTRHECALCLGSIRPGWRVRAQREVFDGRAMTFYICPVCCLAFLRDHRDGDCLHADRRMSLGQTRQGGREPGRKEQV